MELIRAFVHHACYEVAVPVCGWYVTGVVRCGYDAVDGGGRRLYGTCVVSES